jgi:hypothetical protein
VLLKVEEGIPAEPMLSGDFLYRQNEVVIIIALFVALLAATEVGYRLGTSATRELGESSKSQLSALQGAMMGLLALLLAFSFSMAESRFEVRRQLVLEESNAIGTTYLRSRMLQEPFKTRIAALLRDYVDARLEYYQAGLDPDRLRAALAKSNRLQEELWSQAIAVVAKDPSPVPSGLFVQPLNDVIDLYANRDEARQQHVPDIVFVLLFSAAIGTMALVGHSCGAGQRRIPLHTVTVSLIVCFVILVIMDLDRPRRGIIEISQQSMIEVRNSIK